MDLVVIGHGAVLVGAIVVRGVLESAKNIGQGCCPRLIVVDEIVFALGLVAIANFQAHFEGSVVITSAVATRVGRRSLKIQLRTGVVRDCVGANYVLGGIEAVDIAYDGKFRLVGVARVEVNLNAGLAEGPAVKPGGCKILSP